MAAFVWSDEEEVKTALEAVRRQEYGWVLLGYDSEERVQLSDKGQGGLSDFHSLLLPSAVQYVVLGQTVPDQDEGAGFVNHTKYIFITWVGTQCKPMQKASSSQHRRPLYQYVLKYLQLGAELQVLEPSELSESVVLEKLRGTRVEKDAAPAPSTSSSDQVFRSTSTDRVSQAPGLRKPISTPGIATTASFSNTAVKTEVNFESEEEANAALQDLRNDSTDTNWVLFGHTANNKAIRLMEKGADGLDGLLPFFIDDQVVYAILRQVVSEGEYSTNKFIFISWVGPAVKPMVKARSSQTRVALYKHAKNFLQLHAELQVLDKQEISEKIVLDKLCSTL